MTPKHSDNQGMVRVACPGCRTVYQIRRSLLGKKLRCANCRVEWSALAPAVVHLAEDQVSGVDAELMDFSSEPRGQATAAPPASYPHDYWLGKTIGRYEIKSILGTGAVGHVYCGYDAELGRNVAIKILPKPKAEHMTLRVKLFLQEARAAARLQHPNIVTIHEVGLDGQFYFFAMEVVNGGTLKDLTLALGRLAPDRACYLIGQAAQALAYAHANNVIHRDIKPDNLMMDQRGVLKVADFGLAEIGEVDVMKLYKNRPIGTPGYISPETARGEGSTAKSDIYCLGLCLYHVLTGRKYLTAGSIPELIALCAAPPPFQPGAALEGVPQPCLDILARCLEINPDNRYPNAELLSEDLRRFVVSVSRDDSRSQLPLPGVDPFAEMPRIPRSRLSALLLRASRYFDKRRSRHR